MHAQHRVSLCLKDLYHQDVVEMIERETMRYEMWSIEDPEDPDFPRAWELLWEGFGEAGEMERKEVVEQWLRSDPMKPMPSGTFMRYFLIVAKDTEGNVRGVRDGTILLNPAYDPDLCVIYLAHIYVLPAARGTVLSYWLRISPVEIAMKYMADLHARGLIRLPAPARPGKYFGMHLDLVAEMEYFNPEERISWQRILFYGRGGFDAIDPRHFPFQQPDFRDPELIKKTGHQPIPFMFLVRRLGHERAAMIPIDEAQAIARLMYDDHASYCTPESMEPSYDYLIRRLEERAKHRNFVSLLPLPTGPHNINRLRRLFRHTVYTRYYPNAPATRAWLESGIREKLAKQPRYLETALQSIAAELASRSNFVYASRDKGSTWEGMPMASQDLVADAPEEIGVEQADAVSTLMPQDEFV